MAIQKKIHYCWFGRSSYPDLVKKCIDSWKVNLPDWEIILWNEDNSPINEQHPYLLKAINEKKFAFASDYMRCLALYKYGGVYFDTDMEIIKSLDDLLDYQAFIAPENVDNDVYNVAVFGSEKNNPFCIDMIDYLNGLKEYEPIPTAAVNIMKRKDYNITVLDRTSFYPYNPFDPKQPVKQLLYSDIKNETYGIHHWYASWKPSLKSRLIKFIKIYLLRKKAY